MLFRSLVEDKQEAGRILRAHGVNRETLTKVIEMIRAGAKVTSQSAEEGYQALAKYSRAVICVRESRSM